MDNLAHISFAGVEPAGRGPLVRSRLQGAVAKAATLPARRRAFSDGDAALDPLMSWLLDRAGLPPEAYRPAAMQRRVSACLRQLRVHSPQSARDLLERKPEMLPFALNTVLIGVSEFFRDRAVFDYLRDSVLPELLKTRPGLRVLSAGVSGGQELYSMAMLLSEAGALANSALTGIDCRCDAIARAKEGVFGVDDMAGVEAGRRERFFQPDGARWAITPVLKERIQWQVEDLLSFDSDAPCDLILFRNVAIYFNEAHGSAAWTRLYAQLAPGGFIVTGKAERPPADLPFTRVANSIYRKIAISF